MSLAVGRVALQLAVPVPLRDGAHLRATIYLPATQPRPAPCVFTLTPYIADNYHDRGMYFAARGFPFAAVDVRGRGNSDGTFCPFEHDGKDGYDVVEWLASQPYCDGKVGMWGGSYGGYTQWTTAREFPPHLGTIVPVASPCLGVDFPTRNNIAQPYLMQWLSYVNGRASQVKLFRDRRFWSDFYRTWHRSGRAFRELDVLLGNPSAIFQRWLRHPHPDEYWDELNPTPEQYARLSIPVLTITGSYDDNQHGAMEHYRRHVRHASAEARENHYLIIGPWDHAGTRTPSLETGGLLFGPESLVDLPRLHTDWYAWTLQQGSKPAFLKKPVAYYVMGAELWKYADTLDAVTARYEQLFLRSTGAAGFQHPGSLQSRPATSAPDTYRHDPRDVDGPEVDAEAATLAGSIVDDSVLRALGSRALVYETAPFEKELEVSGFFKLSAWISIDTPDTDIYACVLEVLPDGRGIRLSTDAVRARYREGLRQPKPIETREPLLYRFDAFTFVSRQIGRGHRLRLVIAPWGRLIESIFAQKNYNCGGAVSEECVSDARVVNVSVFHDESHPSALHAPVGRE